MKVGVESKKLNTFKIISLFLLIVAGTTSSQNTKCPFQYLYQFGDGVTDVGNSIRIPPTGPTLPAARPPYGTTFPGTPTGRWSDGLIDGDYAAAGVGVLNITAYLSMNTSSIYNGVVFSVANSPVLNRLFFITRNITIPSYATPLSVQIYWFTRYLRSVSSNATDRASRITNSTILFADTEGNDIGYALVQGKSIEEVRTYVPFIREAKINAARVLIGMGATRVLFSANVPLGCYPYILTALPSTNPSAYDELGCLRSVNDLIISKNNDLQQAVNNLKTEFPNVTILYSNDYQAVITVINQTISASGPGRNIALKACCGIGGRYNYDSRRFCGSRGVPVCPNPNQYIYWDGLHFTQDAYHRYVQILLESALPSLNCTSQ